MTKRMIVPLLIGVIGAAVLISLGTWQVRRLEWKEDILSQIEAKIRDAPVAMPAQPDPQADRFLPVVASGQFTDEGVRVLVSVKRVGAGHRLIQVFETEGRRILVDRGFQPLQSGRSGVPNGMVTVTGNLHWPDEIDGYTPDPDHSAGLWFARDVPQLSAHLGTDPIMIIARALSETDPGATPLPVDTSGIPNDHLAYAVTWFGLATVWLGMTALLLWRIRQRTE